jgi:dihydroorotase
VASRVDELKILQPDDFHHHLRDEPYLEHTVPHAARAFRRLLVMPNLTPPVTTTAAALEYRERIMKRLPPDVPLNDFEPLMTLYLTDNTSPEEICKAKESGQVYAVKLYPAGATTNSDFGVTDYEKIVPALAKMAELGLLLLVHGESTNQAIDIFDREQSFYGETMPMILDRVPTLRVVCEHVTSAVGAAFVESRGANVAATITAHHLFYNRNALFKNGINPHFYCLPILKTEVDRLKLLECAVTSPKFFLGTDSAPHIVERKEACVGCAGCFTAHFAVELVAEAFEGVGHLDDLEEFVSRRGAAFYGLPLSTRHRTLVREAWKIPDIYPFGPTKVRPLRSGEEAMWKLRPRDDEDRDVDAMDEAA